MTSNSVHASVSSPALLAEVTRGGKVESRHFGHVVVASASGEVLFSVGDPEHPTFPRSSLKPLQALAGIANGTAEAFGFTDAEIAVTCASHAAEPRHRFAVASILAKIGAVESDLHCGTHPVPHEPSRDELILQGRKPTAIYSNCSGKHAGMLALARVLDAPLAGYWEADHPVQQEIQQVLAAACGTGLSSLEWGVDGCGVPTYLMPLRELALGFARLALPETLPERYEAASARITAAMNAHPGMVRGTGGFDTVLMEALPGVVASKGGAEGCQCVGVLGQGIGVAVKVEDGAARALAPLMLAALGRFGILPEAMPPELTPLLRPAVLNTRGAVVGDVRVCL
ncbi:MAG: asparaginase [Actinomycetota bacterium]